MYPSLDDQQKALSALIKLGQSFIAAFPGPHIFNKVVKFGRSSEGSECSHQLYSLLITLWLGLKIHSVYEEIGGPHREHEAR